MDLHLVRFVARFSEAEPVAQLLKMAWMAVYATPSPKNLRRLVMHLFIRHLTPRRLALALVLCTLAGCNPPAHETKEEGASKLDSDGFDVAFVRVGDDLVLAANAGVGATCSYSGQVRLDPPVDSYRSISVQATLAAPDSAQAQALADQYEILPDGRWATAVARGVFSDLPAADGFDSYIDTTCTLADGATLHCNEYFECDTGAETH